MRIDGVGIDVAEVGRFRLALRQKKKRFFQSIFSKIEQEYCFSYRDAAPHLAGTFAAKEAVRKAQGASSLPLTALEIRREKSGRPEVWVGGKRSKTLLVSISHSKSIACAIALHKKV